MNKFLDKYAENIGWAIAFLLCLTLVFDVSAQVSTAPPLLNYKGTTLPTNCTVGRLFFKTDATAGNQVYSCSAADTWTQIIGAGSTPGGSTTQVQYNNAGAFGGISGWTTNGTTTLTGGASTTLAVSGCTIGTDWACIGTAWRVTSSGHLLATTDNTFDIGASGATRPRRVYAGTQVVVVGSFQDTSGFGAAAAGYFLFGGRGSWTASADGIFLYQNSGATDFGRIQLGGTTSSFPAIKRSAATIVFRLADDSADADISSAAITSSATIKTAGYTVAGLPAGTVGMRAYVTDQTAACAATGAALTGGGAVTCPVFYNGSAWVGG